MVKRLVWENAAKRDDSIQQTLQSLKKGAIVALPSETVYELAVDSSNESAVASLLQRYLDSAKPNLSLLMPTRELAGEFFNSASRILSRLMDRCWPGPLALASDLSAIPNQGDLQQTLKKAGSQLPYLPIRVPGSYAILETMNQLHSPLLVVDQVAGGSLSDPSQIESTLGDQIEILIDAGPSRFPQPATIARVADQKFDILREGVISANRLRRFASQVVIFVCTGNTCRSPMAEAIFKRMLADRLGCDPQDLQDKGYTVMSAGVAALGGQPAAEEAIVTVRDYNSALEDHVSQGLTPELIRIADRLFVMTRQHKIAIEDRWPDAAAKTSMLGGDRDITDPINQPLEYYEHTAQEITSYLERIIDDVLKPDDGRR